MVDFAVMTTSSRLGILPLLSALVVLGAGCLADPDEYVDPAEPGPDVGFPVAEGGPAPEVTFAKDVLPIMQRACQQCHRAGSVAPMSLLTYEEVRPWARAIRDKTAQREMPPWFIERNVGVSRFKEDASLELSLSKTRCRRFGGKFEQKQV